LIIDPAPGIISIEVNALQLKIILVGGVEVQLGQPIGQLAPDLPVGDLFIQQRLLDLGIMLKRVLDDGWQGSTVDNGIGSLLGAGDQERNTEAYANETYVKYFLHIMDAID